MHFTYVTCLILGSNLTKLVRYSPRQLPRILCFSWVILCCKTARGQGGGGGTPI